MILIVSTYYILCISWIIKCLIIIDARYKHDDCMILVIMVYLCLISYHLCTLLMTFRTKSALSCDSVVPADVPCRPQHVAVLIIYVHMVR